MNLARKFLLLIICIGAATACKKDPAENNQLRGRWELSGAYAGNSTSNAYANTPQIIFGDNGQLSGDAYVNYKRYKVKDSVTLSFYDSNNAVQDYRYSIQGNNLYLSQAGSTYSCVGCTAHYIKLGE